MWGKKTTACCSKTTWRRMRETQPEFYYVLVHRRGFNWRQVYFVTCATKGITGGKGGGGQGIFSYKMSDTRTGEKKTLNNNI
jgi:hypothetical protein